MVTRSLIGLCVFFQLASAQEVGLRASSEKKNLKMAEVAVVTVEARLPAEIDTVGPMVSDSLGLFQILNVRRDGSNPVWMFDVMTIDTGSVFLPPISFGYIMKGDSTVRTAYANSLMFTVEGVPVAPDADIREIKPPKSAPIRGEDIWPYLLGVVVIGGGIYLYRRYMKKPVVDMLAGEPPPAIPPHVTALRELRILEEKNLWQQGKVKEYYSEASEIVRRFFEGRWDIRALEMTTDEIIAGLSTHAETSPLKSVLREFFSRADMVKFAKSQPTADEHGKELEQATEIVRGMIPVAVSAGEKTNTASGGEKVPTTREMEYRRRSSGKRKVTRK